MADSFENGWPFSESWVVFIRFWGVVRGRDNAFTFLSWVMVRLRGFEKFNLLLMADDLRALKEAGEEYRRGETISHEELVKKLLEED